MRPLGIYIHIPFCRSKCAYCDFYSVPGRREDMDRYQAALERDFRQWGAQATAYQVDTIYLGGGTPSWFGAERVAQLVNQVKTCFAVSPTCEITMEANPDSVTEAGLQRLRKAGVNRISMGVQSASEEELRRVGRPHSFAQAAQGVQMARRAGFCNVSLDLIYGLPGQTLEGWKRSVEEVLRLEPEHLSCYGLKVEEGTPLWENQSQLALPDEDMQADCYLWLGECLQQAGFFHYEISNFAKPGFESRHNLKYWTLGEYLGFGPAAHSDFGGVRFGNERDLTGYLNGHCRQSEHSVISPQERQEEYVMLGLRTRQGICAEEYLAICGGDFSPLDEKLQFFGQHGLCERVQGRWRLTDQGYLLSNGILTELLDSIGGEA